MLYLLFPCTVKVGYYAGKIEVQSHQKVMGATGKIKYNIRRAANLTRRQNSPKIDKDEDGHQIDKMVKLGTSATKRKKEGHQLSIDNQEDYH